jgi:hypothetical protein
MLALVSGSKTTAVEQITPEPIAQMSVSNSFITYASNANYSVVNPVADELPVKKATEASRSSNRETQKVQCWNDDISSLNHVPKDRSKLAMANIAIACQLSVDEKWYKHNTAQELSCLVELWDRESGWYQKSGNPAHAYGIPQSVPGSKMADSGKDWLTSPATQIQWGLNYISMRYKTPCKALDHHDSNNWY